MIDIDRIRAEFPITERVVYLNHAAIGPIPRRSQRAMAEAIEECLVLDRADWADRDRHVRAQSAELINARPDQIAFIKNTSEGLSLAANGIDWRAGENSIDIFGFSGTLGLIMELGIDAIEARVLALTDLLCEGLARDGYRVRSPRGVRERSGIVIFDSPTRQTDAIFQRLAAENVIVSVRAGGIRVSPHYY